MTRSLLREISKIIDVYNDRKVKYVLKQGILKALIFQLIISLIFMLIGLKDIIWDEFWINLLIKLAVTIIPGLFWGITEFIMYKDILDGIHLRITMVLYVFLYGFMGWGLLCGIANTDFYPFNQTTLVGALITLPVYGIILGLASYKTINIALIRQIFREHIEGKDITSVKLKDKKPKKSRAKLRSIK